MEMDDDLLLLEGEPAPFDIRAEVIRPPQPTALAAPQKTCERTTPKQFSNSFATTFWKGKSTRYFLLVQEVLLLFSLTSKKDRLPEYSSIKLAICTAGIKWRLCSHSTPCVKGEMFWVKTTSRTGILGQRAPTAMAVALDVRHQLLVLVRRPRAFLQPHFFTTRSSTHSVKLNW